MKNRIETKEEMANECMFLNLRYRLNDWWKIELKEEGEGMLRFEERGVSLSLSLSLVKVVDDFATGRETRFQRGACTHAGGKVHTHE